MAGNARPAFYARLAAERDNTAAQALVAEGSELHTEQHVYAVLTFT